MFLFRLALLFFIVSSLEGRDFSREQNRLLDDIFTGKVGDELIQALSVPGSVTGVIISFEGIQGVLETYHKKSHQTREARLIDLHSKLSFNAEQSQKNVISFLKSQNIEHKSFWITNQIHLPCASLEVLKDLVNFEEILEINEEETLHIPESYEHESVITPLAEWGIEKIQAPETWGLDGGNNGYNSIVASIATGVRASHEAIQGNYLNNGYSWFDPYSLTSNPNDGNGLGTHTMGIMVGANGIGVAPGAKWIACMGCSATGSCTQTALLSCGQFVLCPHDYSGSNPDCTKAPHVVNNVWGGGQGSTFHPMIEAWIAGGIIPVFSNGGSGSNCGTSGSPGNHPFVISVGSSTNNDSLTPTSGLGPAADGTIKPDIIAPGLLIRSAYHTSDSAYTTLSGSSMSSPHVAGTIALLVSRKPSLTFEEAKIHLAEGAIKEGLTLPGMNCGNISETTFPNNACGHGRVSALGSMFSLIISG